VYGRNECDKMKMEEHSNEIKVDSLKIYITRKWLNCYFRNFLKPFPTKQSFRLKEKLCKTYNRISKSQSDNEK